MFQKTLIFFGLLFLTSFLLNGCKKKDKLTSDFAVYSSGAEYMDEDGYLLDSLGNIWGEKKKVKRSSVHHFTGKYALELDGKNNYGFNYPILQPAAGEMYQISVWKYDSIQDGTLYCSVEGKNNRLVKAREIERKNGWVKLSLSIIIESNVDRVNCFVSSGGKQNFYDDFQIKRYKISPLAAMPQKRLNLFIPEKSKIKLDGYIKNGVKSWIITKDAKKYVKAFIIDKGDSIPIKMRLKGDWNDHLSYGKISFRIKVLGGNSFMGLKTFSIQHPRTRNFLHEWFFHRLLEQEKFLTTTYKMVPVTINGDLWGVYALEEHFDKQLVESRQYREGPILKLDEQGMWDSSIFRKQKGEPENKFPFYSASYVSVFKKNRTLKSPSLKRQFVEGAKLLEMFKNHTSTPEEVFEIKKLARYFALMELGAINHGFAWHNRRFYYNPVTCKLEQIGFDLAPGSPEHVHGSLSVMNKLKTVKQDPDKCLDKYLLLNKDFRQEYQNALKSYSDTVFIDKQFEIMDSTLIANEKLLASEIDNYSFEKQFYYERASFIRNKLPSLDSLWDNYMRAISTKNDFIVYTNHKPFHDASFVKGVSINAYVDQTSNGDFLLTLDNYHLNDVEVVGWLTKEDKIWKSFETPIKLKAFQDDSHVPEQQVILTTKPSKIKFKVANFQDTIIIKKVLNWPKPLGITSRMELEKTFDPQSKYYSIHGNQLTFNRGSYSIDQLIYIPKNYQVEILPETSIDFIDGGGLIVNNSFSAVGTDDQKIHLFSSDKNNHGITILQGDKVEMKYVDIENLDALHYKNWELTGAVTIYETETTITNCTIDSNLCEDALNIIRSNFDITNMTVSNTYSDGFDADFCTGKISNSSFFKTGNDCIDFSGSEVLIEDITIKQSGDKGISGGERSDLKLSRINIVGAITGIAAKDDTQIVGTEIQISEVEYTLAAFQKKPEYDVATISLTRVEGDTNYLIDNGSQICVDGNCIVGTQSLDIEELYSRFEKK